MHLSTPWSNCLSQRALLPMVSSLLVAAVAAPAYAGALRADAVFTSTLDTPTSFVSFDVPDQSLIDSPSVGDDDDLWLRFADGIYLDISAEWVLSSNLGSLMHFNQDIPHLMVNEEYVPTDESGNPVGSAGPYNNSVVGPASALFINAFGIGTAPTPGDKVFGVLLRDVFEGASPRPTLILEPTSTVTISTPSNQAVVAHQVPEPAAGLIVVLVLAVNAVARRRRRVRAVPLPGHEPNRRTCWRRCGTPSGGSRPGRRAASSRE